MAADTAVNRSASAIEPIEKETMRRVAVRLIPLLMVSYFAAYLDRVNVGFAALTMNKALGFSAAVFGIGSGIFFLGYFLFEIPIQPHPVESRRAQMDRPHPADLGRDLRRHRVHHRRMVASSASASCSDWPRRASTPASSCI